MTPAASPAPVWNRVSRLLALVLLLVPLALVVPAPRPAFAEAGQIDESFGDNGTVRTDLVGHPDRVYSVAAQSDGKIVVGGNGMNLVRYLPSGALDPSFGNGGKAIVHVGYSALGLAIQADGKIVAVGANTVVRFLSNGTLDPTFGTGGVGPAFGGLRSVAIQPDGKIVAGGGSGGGGGPGFLVVRYNADGSLDASFGVNGVAAHDVGGSVIGSAMALQSDGKIVMVGNRRVGEALVSDTVVARLTSSGVLDTSCNGVGWKVTDFSSQEKAHGVAIQPDGKIVVGGNYHQSGGGHGLLVSRYTTACALDAGFGSGGHFTYSLTPLGEGGSMATILIQADGKIIPIARVGGAAYWRIRAMRLTSSGLIDPTFASGGTIFVPWDTNGEEGTFGALLPDNRLAIVGTVDYAFDGADFAAARFFLRDGTSTITSFAVNGGAAATGSSDVTLNLTATDSVGSVDDMSFSNDGVVWSAWQPYATSAPWTLLSGDGTKTVHARVRDATGVRSLPSSDTIVLDTTAPIGTLVVNGGAGATNSRDVTLGLQGTGISEMRFANASGDMASAAWEPFAPTKPWQLSAGGNGTRTVYVQVKDAVGNVSPTFSDTIVYETTAPTVGIFMINVGALASTARDVTLAIQASDTGGSDLVEMAFSNDGGATWSAWEPFTSTKAWTLADGDGTKTVHAWVRDGAGNISPPVSDAITLDLTAGTNYGVSINKAVVWTNTPAVDLYVSAPARTARMMISNDGGFFGAAWEPFTTRKPWTLNSFGSPVTMNVYVRFGDEYGNETFGSRSSDDIVLDVTPPSGSVAVGGGGGGSSLEAGGTIAPQAVVRTVRLSANDSQSSAAMQMRLSNRADFAGALWKPFASQVAWDFTGGGTVYAQYKDGAGNVSPVYSQKVAGTPGPGTSPTPPSCSPRPRVNVVLEKVNGTLRATLLTTGANNGLRAVRFDSFTTAIVDVGDQVNQSGPFAVSIPPGLEPTSLQFTIRRSPNADSATVRLVVIDGCGEWSTVLGGGPKAW